MLPFSKAGDLSTGQRLVISSSFTCSFQLSSHWGFSLLLGKSPSALQPRLRLWKPAAEFLREIFSLFFCPVPSLWHAVEVQSAKVQSSYEVLLSLSPQTCFYR